MNARRPRAGPHRPLSDGAQHSVTVRLRPTDWVVPAGHRLDVVVSSGDSPKLARTASSGRVEVLTGGGGSAISLPVVS
jgi:predicted acyl esterase